MPDHPRSIRRQKIINPQRIGQRWGSKYHEWDIDDLPTMTYLEIQKFLTIGSAKST